MADTDKTNTPAAKASGKTVKASDDIQYFETSVTKLVERENPDTGETETVEVLSDNLYPGEKLKRVDDEEKAAAKKEALQKAAREAGNGADSKAK